MAREQRPLRLQPRVVPRTLVWRLMFGGPFAVVGWMYAAVFTACALCCVLDLDRLVSANPHLTVTGLVVPPLIGLVLPGLQLLFARPALRLLRHGGVTRGTLVAKHETKEIVGDGLVSAEIKVRTLVFEYDVDGRTYSVTVKRNEMFPLEGDDGEPLVYDPLSPSRAWTLDRFDESLKLGARGELDVQRATATHLLISPVLFFCLLAATLISLGIRGCDEAVDTRPPAFSQPRSP